MATKKIRVAFLMQCPYIWDKYRPLCEKMLEHEELDVTGIVVPGYEGHDFRAGRPYGKYGEERK